MKKYLYLALLAPSLMVAQEMPSLFNQCFNVVVKNAELPIERLDQDSKEAVERERTKRKLESAFRTYWTELYRDNPGTAELIEINTQSNLNIALRNKNHDQFMGSGVGRMFQTILADWTHITVISAASHDSDDILDALPLHQGNRSFIKMRCARSDNYDFVISQSPGFTGLDLKQKNSTLNKIRRIDRITESILNENTND